MGDAGSQPPSQNTNIGTYLQPIQFCSYLHDLLLSKSKGKGKGKGKAKVVLPMLLF
jgi:hypothetical protein